jgi:hypothetical protein
VTSSNDLIKSSIIVHQGIFSFHKDHGPWLAAAAAAAAVN